MEISNLLLNELATGASHISSITQAHELINSLAIETKSLRQQVRAMKEAGDALDQATGKEYYGVKAAWRKATEGVE